MSKGLALDNEQGILYPHLTAIKAWYSVHNTFKPSPMRSSDQFLDYPDDSRLKTFLLKVETSVCPNHEFPTDFSTVDADSPKDRVYTL